MSNFRYRAFGLNIASAVELPELGAASHPAEVSDVEIESGQVAGRFENGAVEFEQGRFRLCIPKVGRFEVTDGRKIVVDPSDGQLSSQVRAYLLGSALGALFHQRGVLCLHASVVALGDSAIALIGHSGAGKSTLALALVDAGYSFLCDDLCTVEFNVDGVPVTWPGLRRTKQWSTSLAATGRLSTGLEAVEANAEKYHLPVERTAPDQPHALRAVLVLTRCEYGGSRLVKLTGMSAVAPLISNTFRGSMIAGGGDPEGHFQACVDLARRCSILELRRGWDLSRLNEAVSSIDSLLKTA